MFYDNETNLVYLTTGLRNRYPEIYNRIQSIVFSCAKSVKTIESLNIWCRDYMPLQVNDSFVQFIYERDDFPHLQISDDILYLFNPAISFIRLDGGNCIRYREKAIITEMVFNNNPEIPKKKLRKNLEHLLHADIIFIPVEPKDPLGHADGICRFIDDRHVLINDYSVMGSNEYADYQKRLVHALKKKGIESIIFPFAYHKCPEISGKEFNEKYPGADYFNPAYGYYINFLQMEKLIIFPIFGIEEDKKARESLQSAFPASVVECVDCSKLSMEGGLLSCVTWNTRA